MPRIVQWIWLLLAVHFAVGAIAFTHFLATGQYTLLTVYFNVEGTPFFLLMTSAECALAFACCLWLEREDPMRTIWLMIGVAAFARAVGMLLHALAEITLPWNLLGWAKVHPFGPFEGIGQLGTIVGSPVSMVFLAAGLGLTLRMLRKRHIGDKLTRFDEILVAAIVAFTLSQLAVIAPLFKTHPNAGVMLLWTSDPLLSLLLIEAVVVRRAAIRMGDGLMARCLGMYVTGIVITSAGDAAIWANNRGLLSPAMTVLSWYIWFVAAAAFTSGPAYQLAAIAQTEEEREHELPGFERHFPVPPTVR